MITERDLLEIERIHREWRDSYKENAQEVVKTDGEVSEVAAQDAQFMAMTHEYLQPLVDTVRTQRDLIFKYQRMLEQQIGGSND